jgi:hypothetical protein
MVDRGNDFIPGQQLTYTDPHDGPYRGRRSTVTFVGPCTTYPLHERDRFCVVSWVSRGETVRFITARGTVKASSVLG